MSVSRIGSGKVIARTSETNDIVEVPGRREKSQNYHRNCLKSYVKCIEKINILMQGCKELEASQDRKTTFPLEDANSYSFAEREEKEKLNVRCNSEKLHEPENLGLESNEKVKIETRKITQKKIERLNHITREGQRKLKSR